MTALDLQFASLVAAVIAVICALYVAARAGKWRETDEAKNLIGRLGTVESKITTLEVRLDAMPTKADLSALQSDVRAISREVGKVEDGVNRIEDWLVQRGLGK